MPSLPRNHSTARVDIEVVFGGRLALSYEQHVNVPTSCFGETECFITGLRVVE